MRKHDLSVKSVRRNKRFLGKRSLVEYTYAIMKRVFHFSQVMITLGRRVRVKFMFACFAYNMYTLKMIQGQH